MDTVAVLTRSATRVPPGFFQPGEFALSVFISLIFFSKQVFFFLSFCRSFFFFPNAGLELTIKSHVLPTKPASGSHLISSFSSQQISRHPA